MKKFFLLGLSCFLFSLTTFAQFPGGIYGTFGMVATPNLQCAGDDVELITEVSWDADLQVLMDALPGAIGNTIPPNLPAVFHLVELKFGQATSAFDLQVDSQDIDINIRQFDNSQTPIVILYTEGTYNGLKAQGRYNANGDFIGYTIKNLETFNGGGIATTAVVAIRESYLQLVDRKIEVTRENKSVRYKTTDRTCEFPNSITSVHRIFNGDKEIQLELESASISIYPNPSKGTLFLESTNQLEIQDVIITNLFGQSMNHKVSTRYGMDRVQMDTNHLDTGIYLVQITTSTGDTILKKVAIQH